MDRADQLERGRESYARRAWTEAYESLSSADRAAPLNAEELELLATSAYMLGMNDEYRSALERAHQAYLDYRRRARAARCAFWLGINLMLLAEMRPGDGMVRPRGAAARSRGAGLRRAGLPADSGLARTRGRGDSEAAYATAAEAAEIGMRFGDADLVALVVQEQGHALVRLGRSRRVSACWTRPWWPSRRGSCRRSSPGSSIATRSGSVRSVYELRRAREWTAALTQWWEEQPDMVAFTGRCLVHRAEIMELSGAWRGRAGRSAAGRRARAQG